MKKTLFITIILTILLTSCGTKKETNTIKQDTKQPQINKVEPKTKEEIKEIKEKLEKRDENMKKVYMQELPKDDQKIFTDLENAQKSGDTKKEEELLKQIQSERETKLKILDEAVSKKDDKTAIQIRRELRIYDITLRSAKSTITTTK